MFRDLLAEKAEELEIIGALHSSQPVSATKSQTLQPLRQTNNILTTEDLNRDTC